MTSYKTISIDSRFGPYNGTKTNSDYFWHYLKEIYQWREKTGLEGNYQKIDYITTKVEPGKRVEAVEELIMMQGYDYKYSFENQNYRVSVLYYPDKDQEQIPEIFIREPKDSNLKDVFWHINQVSPNRKGSYSRYIGEVFEVKNIDEVFKVLSEAGTHFQTESIQGSQKSGIRFIETYPSAYTQNTIKYVQYYGSKNRLEIGLDNIFEESADILQKFEQIKQKQISSGVQKYMQPIDHIATRVMSQDRENAILELVKLAPYYPWGAYNIEEQNSSTNPTRNILKLPERYCPAKVFTAGNTAYFLNFLEDYYNTTDIYAYNFGRSLHHIAFSIPDFGDGSFNIDKVVEYVSSVLPEMSGKLFGDREEGLRQIFMKRSRLFGWATEYIQRFDNYHGFFTRQNVASLTGALKEDEKRA